MNYSIDASNAFSIRVCTCTPLMVNVVSMPAWMWSFTWQWSNHVPGFPATISTVWKVPGNRSNTSARWTRSVCNAEKKRGTKRRLLAKNLSWETQKVLNASITTSEPCRGKSQRGSERCACPLHCPCLGDTNRPSGPASSPVHAGYHTAYHWSLQQTHLHMESDRGAKSDNVKAMNLLMTAKCAAV